MSIRPHTPSTESRNAVTSPSRETSAICASTSKPRPRISTAAWSSVAWVRPVSTTRAPNAASPSAMPRPIPRPPPVTTATRPVRSNSASRSAMALAHQLAP